MNILLGCGHNSKPGWIGVDRVTLENVAVVHDLNITPWPFEDDVADNIEAIDVLEHLSDTVAFLDECWRILKANGILFVQAVGWQSENLWRDPTHTRGFHPDTFAYFDPESTWHQTYGHLYTTRTWKVLRNGTRDGNVLVTMMPRKATT